MKIRVKIPSALWGDPFSLIVNEKRQEFIDDILLWGMEVEMDVAFYGYYNKLKEGSKWEREQDIWAVFTVEPDSAFMFCLKWGALQHKGKKKNGNTKETS